MKPSGYVLRAVSAIAGGVVTRPTAPYARPMPVEHRVAAHMAGNGISAPEAEGHLGQWAEEDFYVSLPDELALISDAGFPRPDVFWRDGLIAVYGAFKTAS
jgi:hypothetical protein